VRNILFLAVFVSAVLPVPSSFASSNRFAEFNARALYKVQSAAVTLASDISVAENTVTHPSDDFDCLIELLNAALDISNEADAERDFVELSAQMEDSRDIEKVNLVIVLRVKGAIASIALIRKHAIRQAGFCSTSALVFGYAQKVVTLADNATAAMTDASRGASDTNSQDHQ
jgi:hypothetical protein